MTTETAPLTIGFIGLGVMGAPMAGHLASAGHAVRVFDLDSAVVDRVSAGHNNLVGASSVASAATGADIVFTMLPDGRVVQRVALDDGGLRDSMAADSILVDTSSAQPWLTQESADALIAKGIAMVDAPVSGAEWGAIDADLVFMCGGAVADVDRIRPLLDVMGRAVFHLGPITSGHVMKTINNTITASTFLATAEGLALGTTGGLDPVVMNQVLNESTGGSWITKNHVEQRILSRTFDDPFKLDLMVKDVGIANRLANDHGVPTPVAALCEQLYLQAQDAAEPNASVSELVRWVEQQMGAEIGPLKQN